MAKSPFEEVILERLRIINAEKQMLEEILKESKNRRKEKKDGKTDSHNG